MILLQTRKSLLQTFLIRYDKLKIVIIYNTVHNFFIQITLIKGIRI
jgi:hypothetical protein